MVARTLGLGLAVNAIVNLTLLVARALCPRCLKLGVIAAEVLKFAAARTRKPRPNTNTEVLCKMRDSWPILSFLTASSIVRCKGLQVPYDVF